MYDLFIYKTKLFMQKKTVIFINIILSDSSVTISLYLYDYRAVLVGRHSIVTSFAYAAQKTFQNQRDEIGGLEMAISSRNSHHVSCINH